MTTTDPANTTAGAAVAAPVDRPVRPRAWAIFADNGNARMWSTLQPHVQKLADAEGLTITPLYDQAALDAAVAAERERCAKPVPDEWLVKVRRLVEGFEHVSGIARLWEPDYSSGNERALWARATEACADVAKLLRDVGKA